MQLVALVEEASPAERFSVAVRANRQSMWLHTSRYVDGFTSTEDIVVKKFDDALAALLLARPYFEQADFDWLVKVMRERLIR